jgi:hypothetical protein
MAKFGHSPTSDVDDLRFTKLARVELDWISTLGVAVLLALELRLHSPEPSDGHGSSFCIVEGSVCELVPGLYRQPVDQLFISEISFLAFT